MKPRDSQTTSLIGGFLGFVFLGLLILTLSQWNTIDTLDAQLENSTAIANDVEMVTGQLIYARRMLDLSMTFDINPSIVILVDNESSLRFGDGSDPIWSTFIRSSDELTHRVLSMMRVESRGDPLAIGDNGKAFGLLQMWLGTAREYDSEVTGSNLLSPEIHIPIAFSHFIDLLNVFDGDDVVSYLGWNRGEKRIMDLINERQDITNGYARKVLYTLHE